MLRMTVADTTEQTTTLRLEGRIVEGWTQELRRACIELLALTPGLVLDVEMVTFIDETGIEMLRHLKRNHVRIVGCSMFVSELLERTVKHRDTGFLSTRYA